MFALYGRNGRHTSGEHCPTREAQERKIMEMDALIDEIDKLNGDDAPWTHDRIAMATEFTEMARENISAGRAGDVRRVLCRTLADALSYIQKAAVEVTETIAKRDQEIARWEQRYAESCAAAAEATSQRDAVTDERNAMAREAVEAQSDRTRCRSELEEMTRARDSLEALNSNMEKTNTEYAAALDRLSSQLAAMTTARDAAHALVENYKAEIARGKSDSDFFAREKLRLSKELDGARTEIGALQKAIALRTSEDQSSWSQKYAEERRLREKAEAWHSAEADKHARAAEENMRLRAELNTARAEMAKGSSSVLDGLNSAVQKMANDLAASCFKFKKKKKRKNGKRSVEKCWACGECGVIHPKKGDARRCCGPER